MSSGSSPSDAPRSDALVVFGLTGDLGKKKLFPAIYELAAAGRLDGVAVLGAGRSEHSDDELRAMCEESLESYEPAGGGEVDPSVLAEVDLTYIAGDSTETDTFDRVFERIEGAARPLVYAAVPPDIFGAMAAAIEASAMPETTRLIVEKPFGRNADDARRLFESITEEIGTDRLFIVDHFLAKAAVENLLTVRSANPLISNSLRSPTVESIDVVMSESGDVAGRGSFYDAVGVVDDVVQNHILQMLAMATMDAPDDDSDDAFHRARCELLTAIAPIDAEAAVLGQYDGYRDHEGVDADSVTPTFVSCRVSIDNDRWRGVPITIITGKALSESRTAIVFTLRSTDGSPANRVTFEVKPDPAIDLELAVLDAERHTPIPTTVRMCGPADHGELDDYATMFDNAMSGSTRHFARIDGIVAAWRVVEPLHRDDLELHGYQPGTDGPTVGS